MLERSPRLLRFWRIIEKPVRPHPISLFFEWDGAAPAGSVPLVLLHGFSGSFETWAPVRGALGALGPMLAVDLIGHGASPAPEEAAPYRMESCLEQLEATLAGLGIERAWWVGYSMGGRVALQMAVHKPHLVAGLILESASPGLRDAGERAERRRADAALAARIVERGMEAFVEEWLARPQFKGFQRLSGEEQAAQRAQRLRNASHGLANSLREMGTGAMEPVWGALPALRVPVLLMAGEEDLKFAALAREMAAAVPGAELAVLADAGHTPHVEIPAAFASTVKKFHAGNSARDPHRAFSGG